VVSDLPWQIDQLRPRGIKDTAGNPYRPSYYKRGPQNAIDRGGLAVAEYARRNVYRAKSDGYKKLEEADSLDLACEALVADATKPYVHLFTDAGLAAASMLPCGGRDRRAPPRPACRARAARRSRTRRAGLRVWIPVRGEGFAVRHLLDAGYAVLSGERSRPHTPPAVRVTTSELPPAEAEPLADALAEAAVGRSLIS
jgi:hypothetical protein